MSADGDLHKGHIGDATSSHPRDKEFKQRDELLLAFIEQAIRECRRIRMIVTSPSDLSDSTLPAQTTPLNDGTPALNNFNGSPMEESPRFTPALDMFGTTTTRSIQELDIQIDYGPAWQST